MGTDIWLYIEYKDDKGKWVLDEDQKCPNNCDEYDKDDEEVDCPKCCYDGYIEHDIMRSYLLFSILANVRNDYGLNPISAPRGIPENASEEYIKIANNDPDNHSHSYHTLKQLKEYDEKYDGEEGYEYLKKYLSPIDNFLEELARKYGGDDNVRIVFFFDN